MRSVRRRRRRGVEEDSTLSLFYEKSVLSSQFSVLSSQFSVLSSQFSVLSSQFSVLRIDRCLNLAKCYRNRTAHWLKNARVSSYFCGACFVEVLSPASADPLRSSTRLAFLVAVLPPLFEGSPVASRLSRLPDLPDARH